jgi:Chaperone of endosialidase
MKYLALLLLALSGAVQAQSSSAIPNGTVLGNSAGSAKAAKPQTVGSGIALSSGTLGLSQAINAQIGTSYTIATTDAAALITFSNAGAVAVTLPAATGTGFGVGFGFDIQNKGAGTVTITPTTSTINGASTLVITSTNGCSIVSDGTNYQVSACTAVSPGGSVTPSFTTLSVSSTVSGAGFTSLFASPPSLGTTAPGIVEADQVILSGNLSCAGTLTNGCGIQTTGTQTYTDSSSTGGTIAAAYMYALPAVTFVASAATTYTNAVALYTPAVNCGTNATCTNTYSLYTNGKGFFNGTITSQGIASVGANTLTGTTAINSNQNSTTSIGAGTTTSTVTIGGGANAVTINATTLTLGGSTLMTSSSPTTLSNATIKLSGLATSSATQTGTVCSGTGGLLTVDTTTTCLLSDGRHKMNIEPLDAGISEVLKLKPVSYDLKSDVNPTHLGRQVGLIAQDVIKVDPRLASVYQSGPDKDTPSGVRYEQMVALLVKAIQEQQVEIDGLKQQLEH